MKNICILFGGQSSEHEISCISVMTVLKNLPEDCTPVPVGITRDGRWFLYEGDWGAIENGEWEKSEQKCSAFLSPSREFEGLTVMRRGAPEQIAIDCCFPVLHGQFGEDGTIQGLFELKGIPYVGCGVLSSAVCMDKSYTKILVDSIGVRQAKYVLIDRYNVDSLPSIMEESEKKLGYPVFVKPCRSGSSVGVSRADNRAELEKCIKEALSCDSRVLIEEMICGREVECAVFDEGGVLTASGVGEILAADTFYTYDAKYHNADSRTEMNPDLPEAVQERIRESAMAIFALLGCRNLSRVDFFVEKETNDVVFNEINTLPGFTPISMYPMLMKKYGVETKDLVRRLIQAAHIGE